MAAEQILVNGVTEIIKKVLPVITQQISSAWGVKDDLRKLKDALESIQALITDAEMKQVNDAAVGLWLRRLKEVVYDADDVIDEFSYRTMHSNKKKVDDDDDEVRNSRSVNDAVVFEGLNLYSKILKKLRLEGFSGLNFPKWMMGCSKLTNCLPKLVELILRNCVHCEKLPALGMLPFLRVLKIYGMKSIKCLGEEFYYQQENQDILPSSLFPSLVDLVIELENLEEWIAPPTSCFPSLESLDIIGCKGLRTAPITCLSSLKALSLEGTDDNAVNSFFNTGGGEGCLTSLTWIFIRDSPHLIYLPPLGVLLQHNTPNLQYLGISNCSNIQGFRDDDDEDLKNIKNINSLRSLRLSACAVLTSLPDLRLFTCIQSLYLQDCPGLMSLPDLRLCTSLRELRIFKCDKLKKESIPYDLKKSLTFLDELKVDFIQRDEKKK